MYEHRSKPLLSRREFFVRLVRHGLLAGGIVFIALGVGILGYHVFEGFTWIDATVNASMIFGGMGACQSAPYNRGQAFRLSLCPLFRLGSHCRYGRASCSVRTPVATRISRGP